MTRADGSSIGSLVVWMLSSRFVTRSLPCFLALSAVVACNRPSRHADATFHALKLPPGPYFGLAWLPDGRLIFGSESNNKSGTQLYETRPNTEARSEEVTPPPRRECLATFYRFPSVVSA